MSRSQFRRLQLFELLATREALEDAEDAAAIVAFRAGDATGLSVFIPVDEVYRRLGLER